MADNVFSVSHSPIAATGKAVDYLKGVNPVVEAAYNAVNNQTTVNPLNNRYVANTPANQGVKVGTASSSSSGGSSGSKSSSGGTNASASYSSYLNDLYNQKMAAAQDAYNNGIGRLNDAYNSAANNYGNIYNRGVSTLSGAYNNSQNKINNQAQDSMQQAYVNKMLSMKNLSQALAAQGLSGGASESATAGLINNYGNARNGIQKTWNDNLSDLEQVYNSNLNDLYSAYQQSMASLDAQRASALNALESNLANAVADYSDSYYSNLMANPTMLQSAVKSASASQNAFTPIDAVATNDVNYVDTQQINDMGSVTQAARAKEAEELAKAAKVSTPMYATERNLGILSGRINPQISQWYDSQSALPNGRRINYSDDFISGLSFR